VHRYPGGRGPQKGSVNGRKKKRVQRGGKGSDGFAIHEKEKEFIEQPQGRKASVKKGGGDDSYLKSPARAAGGGEKEDSGEIRCILKKKGKATRGRKRKGDRYRGESTGKSRI